MLSIGAVEIGDSLQRGLDELVAFLPRLVGFLIILLIGWLIARAVKALVGMGVPVDEQDGWVRNKGLRIIGGGVRLELPWPELSSYPGYGLVRTRLDFDEILARTAQKAAMRGRSPASSSPVCMDPMMTRLRRVTGADGHRAGEMPERGHESLLCCG